MPYRPTPAQQELNRLHWKTQRGDGLSDDELMTLENGGIPREPEDRDGPWNDYASPSDEAGPWNDYRQDDGGLSDEEMFALEAQGQQPKPLDDNELGAARALRFAGLGMGWGDEVVGGAAALGKYVSSGFDSTEAAKAYRDEQARAEDISRRYEDERPGESLALDIVGGAPAGAAIFRGAQAIGRGVGAARRFFAGGKAAAEAAPKAGVVSRTLLPLAATGALGTAAYNSGIAGQSLPEKVDALTQPGPLMLGAGVGLVAAPLGGAVSRGISRMNPFRAFASSESKAARFIGEKLRQSGMTPDEWRARQAEAAATGKPVTLADTGPEGARDAAAMAAREPGAGREFAQKALGSRQEGQGSRLTADLQQASGTGGKSFQQTSDEIGAARAQQAKPLYEQAMKSPPLRSLKLSEVMNRPSAKEALQRGRKIAQNEGVELAPAGSDSYTMQELHYAQQALGDMIESAQRSGDMAAARAYTILRNQLLGEVDRINPSYGQARKVFAGHSANQRALESGRKAANHHPDQIKSDMAAMSESERDFYRQGYVQKVTEEIESSPDGANALRRVFGNPARRARLKAVLGDEKYAALEKRFGIEQSMYETNRRARLGSPTAERIGASEDFREFVVSQSPEIASGMVQAFSAGRIGPLARSVVWPYVQSLYRGTSERTRAHISKMLLSDDPKQVRSALEMIAQQYKKAQSAAALREAAGGSAAAISGNDKARAAGAYGAASAYSYSPYQPF